MKRSTDPKFLSTLPSVNLINYEQSYDWIAISQTRRHIDRQKFSIRMPKDVLTCMLYDGRSEITLHLKDPIIACIKVGQDEYREFIFTSEGILLEYDHNSLWDGAFSPFITKECRPINMVSPQETISLPGQYHWFNYSHNYTHFLHDGLSPLLSHIRHLRCNTFHHNLLFLGKRRKWQDEILFKLNMNLCNLESNHSLVYFWIRPKELFLTLEHNLIGRDSKIRRWIQNAFNLRDIKPRLGGSRIVFNDRNDYRQNRITNIDQIREFARNNNIIRVIPETMSILEKWELYNSSNICISESSGNMNPAIFSDYPTKMIALANSASWSSIDMLYGGWSHSLGYLYRSKTLWGHNIQKRDGAIAPSEYSTSQLRHILSSDW